jgi:plastocyanin
VRRSLLALCVGLAACGGGGTTPAPTPNPQPNSATFTITASGVGPKELSVAPGSRVLFVNGDSRRHDMGSDPHPDHTDCPEINSVGVLSPGQSRETANLNAVRTCGFHDHERPTDATLRGRIIIR